MQIICDGDTLLLNIFESISRLSGTQNTRIGLESLTVKVREIRLNYNLSVIPLSNIEWIGRDV